MAFSLIRCVLAASAALCVAPRVSTQTLCGDADFTAPASCFTIAGVRDQCELRDNRPLGFNSNCAVTMMTNANCNYVGTINGLSTASSIIFTGRRNFTVTAMPAVCGFSCDCGQITITGDDGLPVELMEIRLE